MGFIDFSIKSLQGWWNDFLPSYIMQHTYNHAYICIVVCIRTFSFLLFFYLFCCYAGGRQQALFALRSFDGQSSWLCALNDSDSNSNNTNNIQPPLIISHPIPFQHHSHSIPLVVTQRWSDIAPVYCTPCGFCFCYSGCCCIIYFAKARAKTEVIKSRSPRKRTRS